MDRPFLRLGYEGLGRMVPSPAESPKRQQSSRENWKIEKLWARFAEGFTCFDGRKVLFALFDLIRSGPRNAGRSVELVGKDEGIIEREYEEVSYFVWG